MLTYEVKITIDAPLESEWLHWMRTVHVPDLIATGLINSFRILKSQGEAHTYHFHYHFDSQESFDTYTKEHAGRLREDVIAKYANRFQASRQVYDWI